MSRRRRCACSSLPARTLFRRALSSCGFVALNWDFCWNISRCFNWFHYSVSRTSIRPTLALPLCAAERLGFVPGVVAVHHVGPAAPVGPPHGQFQEGNTQLLHVNPCVLLAPTPSPRAPPDVEQLALDLQDREVARVRRLVTDN